MTDIFAHHIITAYKIMIENGNVMESGTIVLDDDNIFSYKIRKLVTKKKKHLEDDS